jgi:hypothetical protein
MPNTSDASSSEALPELGLAVRTLMLNGFKIETNRRQPGHTELSCTTEILGTPVRLLLAFTQDEFTPESVGTLREIARRESRSLVMVGAHTDDLQLGWKDFLDALGGGLPSWRALSKEYSDSLIAAAQNQLPAGYEGEAWRIFEDLVEDGLAFIFGRKVHKLGAKRRGAKVSDMTAQLPDGALLVVDAKASKDPFDAAIHNLRALAEYTRNQVQRQRGHFAVSSALIVAFAFVQNEADLLQISREFSAQSSIPVSFLTTRTLQQMVTKLSLEPKLRSGLNWRLLFAGGITVIKAFDLEVKALKSERVER